MDYWSWLAIWYQSLQSNAFFRFSINAEQKCVVNALPVRNREIRNNEIYVHKKCMGNKEKDNKVNGFCMSPRFFLLSYTNFILSCDIKYRISYVSSPRLLYLSLYKFIKLKGLKLYECINSRRYMTEIVPIRRKTLSNQSIKCLNNSSNQNEFLIVFGKI